MLYGGGMQITINITNPDTNPSVHVEQHFDAPASEPIPRIAPVFTEPMSDDDRAMLFAAWRDAFGDIPRHREAACRHSFTRTTLGLTYDDDPSWSRGGSLTSDQAYYMKRVLNVIAAILA